MQKKLPDYKNAKELPDYKNAKKKLPEMKMQK